MQIGSSNDSAAVKAQYATSKGLDIRITFHEKYSVNKQGYGKWLVSHYDFHEGMKVLELGGLEKMHLSLNVKNSFSQICQKACLRPQRTIWENAII